MIEQRILPLPLTVRLRATDRAALADHFLALEREDRRLRFGISLGDQAVREYVDRIDFGNDRLFAAQDDELRLIAVVHVAFGGAGAELGLSVLRGFRGQGHGSALICRALVHLRNHGAREVFVHCLAENSAMMHIARKHGMRIVFNAGEGDARLAIDPPTAHSYFTEWLHDRFAFALQTARRQAQWSRALAHL